MNLIALMAVMGFASLYPSYDSATRLLTMSRAFCLAHEAASALGTRLSLLPPFSRDNAHAQPGRIAAGERERMAADMFAFSRADCCGIMKKIAGKRPRQREVSNHG
jgi:hypothetical protein